MKKITISYVFNSGIWKFKIVLGKAAVFPCCKPSFHRRSYLLVLQFNRSIALPPIKLYRFHIKYQILFASYQWWALMHKGSRNTITALPQWMWWCTIKTVSTFSCLLRLQTLASEWHCLLTEVFSTEKGYENAAAKVIYNYQVFEGKPIHLDFDFPQTITSHSLNGIKSDTICSEDKIKGIKSTVVRVKKSGGLLFL